MSTRKQPSNIIQRLVKQVWRFFKSLTKTLINWFLRTLFVFNRRRTGQNQAGFVLPTIVMVMLVVLLLTTAILFRSFNRPKNASNLRVDKATYAAAAPALDRARAKLSYLFSTEETELKGNTPEDDNIAEVFEKPKYTFGDETQVKVVSDFDGTTGIGDKEQLKTAWKFAVDTDNNGRFDSYTLYGIYFRTPAESTRKRGPVEARSLPQDEGESQNCAGAGGGGGPQGGWTTQSNGQLKKAFFTYVATVPISNAAGLDADKFEPYKGNRSFSGLEMQQDQARLALDNNAVWYRNDLEIIDPAPFNVNGRVHTNGNLVVAGSDGDAIKFWQVSSPDSCYYNAENSKIQVGGNVIAGALTDTSNRNNDLVQVHLFQKGRVGQGTNPGSPSNTKYIDSTNVTTKSSPANAAANNAAYDLRLNLLVKGAVNLHNQTTPAARKSPTKASVEAMGGRFPKEVIEAFAKKVKTCDPNCKDSRAALENLLTRYFEERIRQVPNAEIPPADSQQAIGNLSNRPNNPNFVFRGGGIIAAPVDWMRLDESITNVPLNINGSSMALEAGKPTGNNTTERYIGDRIVVGNSLPFRWLKQGTGNDEADYAKKDEKQPIPGVNWNDGSGQRERKSSVQPVPDVADTSRNGYWESAAAFTGTVKQENDKNPELLGGLRVITGAGVYVDGRGFGQEGTGKRIDEDKTPGKNDVASFLPPPPTVEQLRNKGVDLPDGILPRQLRVVWPETMPSYQWFFEDNALKGVSERITRDNIPQAGEGIKGDLQMKATVVYHYASDPEDDQRAPIACISSYYNNSNSLTTGNVLAGLGLSNNGINYGVGDLVSQRRVTAPLERQARMIFPDGRLVNEPLKDAIDSLKSGATLTLSEIAALDAANCALNILNGTAQPAASPIPDGAIKEAAFLDARQVKALHKSLKPGTDGKRTTVPETLLADITEPKQLEIAELSELSKLKETPVYDLPIEQRQPLEIRVTEIDLSRDTGINRAFAGGTNQYVIPNSGIIYATRDDAKADSSDINGNASATDFKLDPTREAFGIRLVKGQNLAREDNFRKEEKGFILASDLPVYVKGDFNLHATPGGTGANQIEEFNQVVDSGYSNFYNRLRGDLNKNFACRQGGTNCESTGDQWRAARILSDAITIQSAVFQDGLRADGDYDLNNNAGNWAVESRLKNGFWWNDFATTAEWYDNTGFPKDLDAVALGTQGSSYVMNSVTPIQRRKGFPAYLMEACLKKPVSACGPDDWYVGVGGPGNQLALKRAKELTTALRNNPKFTANNAGTTADQATGIFEGAVRRVAFVRDENGQLVLEGNFAQPIAASGQPLQYPGGQAQLTTNTRDNALWFWTTSDNADPHPTTGTFPAQVRNKPSYNNNTLLYYEEALESVSDRQLLLPGTPEFPVYPKGTALTAQFLNRLNGTVENGLASEDNASDYTVCMTSGASKQYKEVTLGTTCPQPAITAITQARVALIGLPDVAIDGENPVAIGKTLDNNNRVIDFPNPYPATGDVEIKATAKVNVYDLPNNGQLANQNVTVTINLDSGAQSDPIFVLRKKGPLPLTLGRGSGGVRLNLNGVSPNNVFWVTQGGVRIREGGSAPNNTKLAGNFIGRGNLTINGNPELKGVRFLGFDNLAGSGFPTTMTAMTSTDEPLLVPVLQLHSPEGAPAASAAAAFGPTTPDADPWLSVATTTNVNAVLVMGDSPSRVIPEINSAESGGGLHNFPRFMERWQGQGNKINGSLIQFRRSSFATAPFQPIENPTQDTSLFFDGANPDYTINGPETDYRYRDGAGSRTSPFYFPPTRSWGYDVGLLKQSPDLFSKNFAIPSAGSPNEYFREVGKDDDWVKNLLCAAKQSTPNGPFDTAALSDRADSCPPLTSYQ